MSVVTCCCSIGVFSQFFSILNGFKQGGIVSRILFCVQCRLYIDGLLLKLRDLKIGCWIGNVYVGALA